MNPPTPTATRELVDAADRLVKAVDDHDVARIQADQYRSKDNAAEEGRAFLELRLAVDAYKVVRAVSIVATHRAALSTPPAAPAGVPVAPEWAAQAVQVLNKTANFLCERMYLEEGLDCRQAAFHLAKHAPQAGPVERVKELEALVACFRVQEQGNIEIKAELEAELLTATSERDTYHKAFLEEREIILKICGEKQDLEAEVARLKEHASGLLGEKDDLRAQLAACKLAVVATIGGTVEGAPTHELNYLQRLRELVDKEAATPAPAHEAADAAIRACVDTARGRESEWGSRAQAAFEHLHGYLGSTPAPTATVGDGALPDMWRERMIEILRPIFSKGTNDDGIDTETWWVEFNRDEFLEVKHLLNINTLTVPTGSAKEGT